MKLKLLFIICFLFSQLKSFSQQKVAEISIPKFDKPRFEFNKGPKVAVDQQHHNFHTFSGRFNPFIQLIQNDGYQVDSILSLQKLREIDVLIISNPIHKSNLGNWQRPIYSAFSDDYILEVENWVKEGGNLLLIADHMPFAGAANNLAKQFGFNFCDGFAQLSKKQKNTPDVFSLANKRLGSTAITDGTFGTQINAITTFTGSSFSIPKQAKGILKFSKEDICLAPEIAWQFNETTKKTNLEDKYQGAILNYGKGKIAIFGEAAMFTAQTITNQSGTFKFGFHAKQAPNNINFIRNLMYWLSK